MLLSVVVPAYDIEAYLGRCLQSLRDQDMGPDEYEVIVVDDGSTDDSRRVAQEHAAADPRVRVISQDNQGLSAARNAGTDAARGHFLYYVDGDDYVEAGSLRPVAEWMRRHRLEVVQVGARKLDADEAPGARRHEWSPEDTPDVVTGIDYMADHHVPAEVWWYMLERELLQRNDIRFELGRYLEDGIFTPSVLAAATRVAAIEYDVYRYIRRPGSIMRDSDPTQVARLVDGFERVVFGLEELRARTIADGRATPSFLDRLTVRQEGYVFFMLGRLVRASIPVRPTLPDALARLRAGGFYPLTVFPGEDYPGIRYRLLTEAFNRRFLLYPLAYAYRAVGALRRRLRGRR